MPTPRIPIDMQRISDFCRRHHIRRLSIFGSVLRDDFGPDSDVDFLYVFEDGRSPGWEIVDIEQELAAIIGRKVDFVSAKYLNPRVAVEVMPAAIVVYDAGVADAA